MGLVLIVMAYTENEYGAIMTKIASIYEAIRSIDPNLDLSNPCQWTDLPFPSPLRVPWQRFSPLGNGGVAGGVTKFRYMGRHMFSEVLKDVENPNAQARGEQLYLYGTSGTGKSHLLAAITYQLVRQGKRVVYIPDCRELIMFDPFRIFLLALLFAFHDHPPSRDIITAAKTLGDLLEFQAKQLSDSMYIVVDQRNALDLDQSKSKDPHRKRKENMVEFLNTFSGDQVYIFSASANEESLSYAERSQTRMKPTYLLSGMTTVSSHLFRMSHLTSPRRRCPLGGTTTTLFRITLIQGPARGSSTRQVASHYSFDSYLSS
jgi:Cdc6-like AAA superfamily ATPase